MNNVSRILKTFNSKDDLGIQDMHHAADGIASEAGEILDCIKHQVWYDGVLDVDALEKEIGDLDYYLTILKLCLVRNLLSETCYEPNMDSLEDYPKLQESLRDYQEILDRINKEKLDKRHRDGFSAASAAAKADTLPKPSETPLEPVVAPPSDQFPQLYSEPLEADLPQTD